MRTSPNKDTDPTAFAAALAAAVLLTDASRCWSSAQYLTKRASDIKTAILLAFRAPPAKRTRYAIRFVSRLNHDWVSDEALTFDSMTAANIYAAMTLGLAPEDYTVEAV